MTKPSAQSDSPVNAHQPLTVLVLGLLLLLFANVCYPDLAGCVWGGEGEGRRAQSACTCLATEGRTVVSWLKSLHTLYTGQEFTPASYLGLMGWANGGGFVLAQQPLWKVAGGVTGQPL